MLSLRGSLIKLWGREKVKRPWEKCATPCMRANTAKGHPGRGMGVIVVSFMPNVTGTGRRGLPPTRNAISTQSTGPGQASAEQNGKTV